MPSSFADTYASLSLSFYLHETPCTERRWFQIARMAFMGSTVIMVAYGVLAYIISKEANSSGSGIKYNQGAHQVENPWLNTQLIGDGICDEWSNTANHSWDGGDCCMDITKKDTSRCKICTCQLTVDEEQLKTAFKQMQVMKLTEYQEFNRRIASLTHVASSVKSEGVCSTLCLFQDFSDAVNGWMYDSILKTCSCAWIEVEGCLEGLSMEPISEVISDGLSNSVAVIQMAKVLEMCNTSKPTNAPLASTAAKTATSTSTLTPTSTSMSMKTTTTATLLTDFGTTKITTVDRDWLPTTTINGEYLTLDNGLEFFVMPPGLGFYKAAQNCLDLGGRLFEPQSHVDMRLLSQTGCIGGKFCDTYIGVTDVFSEGNFVYVSNGNQVPEDLARWNGGEPNNVGGEEHFVTVQPDLGLNSYKWNDHNENWPGKSYVCELESGPHYEIIELSGGLRIFIGFEKMNLEGAIHYCNNRGGRVYEPRDAHQRDQVEQKSYEAQLLHGYWLGITDMEEEGVFAYLSDGLPIYDGLAKWADNEPNNFMHSGASDQDGEDAVVHNFNNWKKWNDNRPDDPGFHVVCEML